MRKRIIKLIAHILRINIFFDQFPHMPLQIDTDSIRIEGEEYEVCKFAVKVESFLIEPVNKRLAFNFFKELVETNEYKKFLKIETFPKGYREGSIHTIKMNTLIPKTK